MFYYNSTYYNPHSENRFHFRKVSIELATQWYSVLKHRIIKGHDNIILWKGKQYRDKVDITFEDFLKVYRLGIC